MAKILEVYGSTTGNTESIAHAIEAKLQAAGNDVTVVNAADAQADGLADGYDAVLFGASCWGDEDIEMQEDFAALFENADKMNLKGKKMVLQFFWGKLGLPRPAVPLHPLWVSP